MKEMLTVREAAKEIGVTPAQVSWLIREGKLKARKKRSASNQHGYVYLIDPNEAARYKSSPRKRGPQPGR
jgi:hypothetical protein